MTSENLKLHQNIEAELLSMMNSCDYLTHNLMKLHNESYEYAADHLNNISTIKEDCKKILNKDFDQCALRRK
jgi:hypothetical protein